MAEAFDLRPKKGVRGVSWTRQETLDLISIWGEERVQQQLKESHRNIDIFENIARQMRKRAHRRTAEECRTKSKSLRQKYHNARSGNGAAAMPYFEELHSIFQKDATVHLKRVPCGATVHALPTGQTATAEHGYADLLEESSREMFTSNSDLDETVITLTSAEQSPATAPQFGGQGVPASPEGCSIPACSLTTSSANDRNHKGVQESGCELLWSSGRREQEPVVANRKATLSPEARFAEYRKRRERRAAGDMADRLIAHSTAQLRELLSHLEREGKEYMEYRRKEDERQRFEDECARRDRERITTCIEKQTGLLATLVEKIGQSQGSVKGMKGCAQQKGNIPSSQEQDTEMEMNSRDYIDVNPQQPPGSQEESEAPGTSFGFTPQNGAIPGSHKGKAARFIRHPTPYSP
ncbi:uncharacterized protein LOC121922536 isoform X2 [Sceloporus undulatus]|uniref:uncharacterized protein LOC121922536 isoform X2 n=1 Tax=Sceloporus undulatus TaxID=8520 RepID=UPI001C4BCA1B|nr:uncharacterized protein LOC121922536 isoform X2 [Sceloporus undulatus]